MARPPVIGTADPNQQTAARVAGVAYLFTFVLIIFANFAIQGRLIVEGNAAATAQNIIAHERLFRIAIACELIYSAGLVVLLTALYVILKTVQPHLALVAAFCRLVYALIWVFMTLHLFEVVRLLNGADYLRVFEPERLQALARLQLGSRFWEYYAGLLFYALASAACSYLWLKSRYIPRPLAGLGLIASVWAVFCTLVFIVSPRFQTVVNLWWFDSPMGGFELILGFWLVMRGIWKVRFPELDRTSTADTR